MALPVTIYMYFLNNNFPYLPLADSDIIGMAMQWIYKTFPPPRNSVAAAAAAAAAADDAAVLLGCYVISANTYLYFKSS
jgi:hypothetical protein